MGAHVLVVDDDPHILRMLTDVLAKKGFAVDTAKDGEEAYERALAKAPDLLVTDVMMPKLDGWSLVRKLRLEPKLATLPVIFLTALGGDDDRIKAFSLGADDYVNKPFKLNDVVARVEKVLTAKSPASASKQMASSGLSGDLAQVGLSTLLVLVEMERKTGVMKLTSADGRTGRMAVKDGKVLDARVDDAPDPGAQAVYLMLTWSQGKFDFTARDVEMEDRIGMSTTGLLMEGARLMDEASAPAAEANLDEDAIAEWNEDERAPVVAAAKLADGIRRSARSSTPPYTQFSSPGFKLPPIEPGEHPVFTAPTMAVLAKPGAKVEITTPAAKPPESAAPAAKPQESAAEAKREPASEAKSEKPNEAKAEASEAKSEKTPEAKIGSPTAAPPRRSSIWIVLALLVAGGGAATFAIKPAASTAEPVPTVDVKADVAGIAGVLDRGVDTAQMRANGFASAPMLRTGIETDAATLQDMAKTEGLLQPGPGEVVEIFQTRDGASTSMLRTPASAPAIPPDVHARVAPTGKAVEVIATAPILSQQGTDAGIVAVSVVVDLEPAAKALASHVTTAKLVGFDRDIELVEAPAGPKATRENITIAKLTSKAKSDLSLHASITAPPAPAAAAAPGWLAPARYGAFALAGLLLVLFFVVRPRS